MWSIYRREINIASEIDTEVDLIVNEERVVKHSLFGINLSNTKFNRINSKYKGDKLVNPEVSLGFNKK